MKTFIISTLILCLASVTQGYAIGQEDRIIDNATQISIHAFDSDESGRLMIDRNGMLWMGSSNGLISFDGYLFKTYKSDAYSPHILPNNVVVSLAEDLDDNIWIGTRDGLVRMNRKDGSFKTFHLPLPNQRIIYCLHITKDGTLWIGTDGGLTRYDKKNESFHTYNTGTYYSVKSIIEDHKGNIYIGTWDTGLMRLRADRKTIDHYPRLNALNSSYALFMDSRKRLWIGTWEYGIAMIEDPDNYKNPTIRRYNGTDKNFKIINNIIEEPLTKTIWACSRDGISIYDEANDTFKNYTRYKLCGDIATDKRGHIFVATVENGVLKLDATQQDFTAFQLSEPNGKLQMSNIESIFTADGRTFWLGLKPCGIALHDKLTGKTLYNMDIPQLKRNPDKSNITKAIVPSIVGDNGKVWMANSSFGVFVVNGSDIRQLDSKSTNFIADNYVNCLFRDYDGNIWIGQRGGLSVAFSENSGRKIVLKDGKRDFSLCDVRGISQDRKGNIWIATDNEGIIKLSGNPRQDKTLDTKQYCARNRNFALNDAKTCLEGADGRLWAISNDGGLFLYDADNDRFEPKNRQFHIHASRVCAIAEDIYNCLWLSTDKAFLRLSFADKETVSIRTYTNEDGKGRRIASINTLYRHADQLYIGGNKALLSIKPTKPLTDEKPTSRLIVTDIYIDDRPLKHIDSTLRSKITRQTPEYTKKITIPSSISKFSVEFALLSYFNQDLTRYAYFLEGYDKEWHFIDASTRRATFENLPSGHYKLHIEAADSKGCIQELPYTIDISILPPWYKTWWAYLCYVLLVTLALFAAVVTYRNHIKTKNRLQMAVVFTNITHELLTPLTVIKAVIERSKASMPSFEGEYEIIDNNINNITHMLRQILEVRKSQAGQLKLKVSRNNLAEFVEGICSNIRPMAASKNIALDFNCPHPTKLAKAWFDTDKMAKILNNLISNSIKYNKEQGCVKVTLCEDSGKAVITVEDNGIGMTRQQLRHLYTRFLDGDYRKMKTAGTGIGLSLTRDLVRLHHGTIECKSQIEHGTTFTVTLPIAKKAYAEEETEQRTPLSPSVVPLPSITGFSLANSNADRDDNTAEYKALLVEDNEELLLLMKQMLQGKFQVFTAKNGKQALNIIRKRELDIVISDVVMPIMDGIELTKTIKEDKDYAQLPIILLTAKTGEEDRILALKTGADDYITKPFSLDDLEVRVDNIIKNRQRIREKFSAQTEFSVEQQHYSNPDQAFIQKCIDCVMQHLDDADYDRETFAKDMCVSASTLYNKLRAVTGQSVTGFITSIRLKEACRQMHQRPDISIAELSMNVGFNTPKYFTKCFKKEFGMSPSDFARGMRPATDLTT
ncbi:MAG: two-component regulator propeller domain-containing protein [Prevotella sp.]